jgi:hypothetical protein
MEEEWAYAMRTLKWAASSRRVVRVCHMGARVATVELATSGEAERALAMA